MTNALFPSVADFHPADLEARYGEHEDGQQEEAKNCNQGRGRVGTEGDQGERPPWSSAWAGTSTGRPMLRPARQPRRSLRTVFDPKRTSSPSSSSTGSWLLPVVLLRLVYCHSDHARQLERAGFRSFSSIPHATCEGSGWGRGIGSGCFWVRPPVVGEFGGKFVAGHVLDFEPVQVKDVGHRHARQDRTPWPTW